MSLVLVHVRCTMLQHYIFWTRHRLTLDNTKIDQTHIHIFNIWGEEVTEYLDTG